MVAEHVGYGDGQGMGYGRPRGWGSGWGSSTGWGFGTGRGSAPEVVPAVDLEALSQRWPNGVRAESTADGWSVELLPADWLRGGRRFEGATLAEAVVAAWGAITKAGTPPRRP